MSLCTVRVSGVRAVKNIFNEKSGYRGWDGGEDVGTMMCEVSVKRSRWSAQARRSVRFEIVRT